jgi:hypothetical protein
VCGREYAAEVGRGWMGGVSCRSCSRRKLDPLARLATDGRGLGGAGEARLPREAGRSGSGPGMAGLFGFLDSFGRMPWLLAVVMSNLPRF